MKTTERLTQAVNKLVAAYHEDRLNAFECKACAVGNICDNTPDWSYTFGHICNYYERDKVLNYFYPDSNSRDIHELKTNPFTQNGYTALELYMVEETFLTPLIGLDTRLKENQLKAILAVVKYLCNLDNITNVEDYTKLFEIHEQ